MGPLSLLKNAVVQWWRHWLQAITHTDECFRDKFLGHCMPALLSLSSLRKSDAVGATARLCHCSVRLVINWNHLRSVTHRSRAGLLYAVFDLMFLQWAWWDDAPDRLAALRQSAECAAALKSPPKNQLCDNQRLLSHMQKIFQQIGWLFGVVIMRKGKAEKSCLFHYCFDFHCYHLKITLHKKRYNPLVTTCIRLENNDRISHAYTVSHHCPIPSVTM